MFLSMALLDKIYSMEIEINANSMSIDEMYKKIKKLEKDVKELTEKKPVTRKRVKKEENEANNRAL